MGLFKRAGKIVESQWNDHKERAVSPEEQMQATYEQMIKEVSAVKQSLGEVQYAQERLIAEHQDLLARAEALVAQAATMLEQGDEARARELLIKRKRLTDEAQVVQERADVLRSKIAHLQDAQEELHDHVHAFRDRRESMDAREAMADAALSLQKARHAIDTAAQQGLSEREEQVRVKEAHAELTEDIDEQLERLRRGE